MGVHEHLDGGAKFSDATMHATAQLTWHRERPMKAIVCERPGVIRLDERPDPTPTKGQ